MNPSQPLIAAGEQILMSFCAHLADCLLHFSIKVYLSTVCSLHIDFGYADPFFFSFSISYMGLSDIKVLISCNTSLWLPIWC